jgi:DNA polymerase-3 subunit beta
MQGGGKEGNRRGGGCRISWRLPYESVVSPKEHSMKFIVSSSALLKQLQQISGVINANTVLPILEDFLFEVEKNKLTVVATDLETVMKVHLEVESKESGKVCIPAKILIDSLKNIADQPLTFNIDKHFAVELTSDNGKYKVMGENPDNFPKEPASDEATRHFSR